MRQSVTAALERLALILGCLTVAWGPLAQGSTFGWGMSGLVLLGCLTLAATLLAMASRGSVQVANPWWVGAAAAFLAWVWASTGWAADQWEAFRWAGVWTAVIGTAFSMHVLGTSKRRQMAVLTTMILTGMAALVVAYLQTHGIFVPGFEHYPGTGPKLVTGPYFNPSHFSGFLIPMAALITSLILFTRPHIHTLALVGALLALHVMNLKTDSSSIPAVLLSTGLPFLIWAWVKSKWAGAVLTAFAVSSVIACAAFFTTPNGQDLFKANQARLGIHRQWSSFLHERRAVWRYGSEIWRDAPLSGLGVGQFALETARYRAPERAVGARMDRKNVNYAHNDVLQITSELGGVGILLFSVVFTLSVTSRLSSSTLRPAIEATWLTTLGLIPPLLFSGIYDAHVTAIPGTGVFIFALLGLGMSRVLVSAPQNSDLKHSGLIP